MQSAGRNGNGTFAKGNIGGPGRPARAIERDYLAAIGDAVTVADWRDVVARALADAKEGDNVARAWLAKYLVGEPAGNPTPNLAAIATRESCGLSAEDDIRRDAERTKLFDGIAGRLQ